MKKVVLLLMVIIGSLVSLPVSAGVQDFYFSDFTGDYYLSKDAEGISHLKVMESVTAVFPDFDQNKGICRQIPYTNQDGTNVTLPNLSKSNIKVTRNGQTEPIYSIEKNTERDNYYYEVCTGTDDYLRGKQRYTFEYEFTKVVTEFTENGRLFQELYWDTNGNGARQRFDKVTARLHFEDTSIWSGDSWCYVGKYGENGSERCTISKIENGVEFSAENLLAKENLSFDVELLPKSFVVPEPESNYAYVWLMVILVVICGIAIALAFAKLIKMNDKKNYYKSLFVKPEYQPNKDYSLPEMAELYLGKKKDAKVAMLLELVVNKNIELKKGEGKKEWSIIVKNLDNVEKEYLDLLAILYGGIRPNVGTEFEIKSRTATPTLVTLRNTMQKKIEGDLERDGLATSKWKYGTHNGEGFGSVITTSIFVSMILGFLVLAIPSSLEETFEFGAPYGGEMVFGLEFYLAAPLVVFLTVFIVTWLLHIADKYEDFTFEGLKMSRYMDGLELYISMAEADRMKLLQSVEGADTSPEGIVKLYEKLLPYAAVFGLEESWMDEMKEYCKVEDLPEPDYLLNGIMVSDLSRGLRSAASTVNTSTIMSSSGGSSSSGFSGGGGGGFSGGGGGGGGFGGR